MDLPRGTGFGRHRHDDHQLIIVDRGVVGLATPGAVWAAPAGCGTWLPARSEHELVGIADARATFVYLSATAVVAPPAPGAVTITPLLRELVATLSSPGARRGDRRTRLEAILLDELGDVRPFRLLVPLPADPAARQVAAAIIATPSDHRTIDQFGAEVGASGRTLQRRFAAETGLGFRAWRRMARLQGAMVALQAGASVTTVAYTSGWSSVSAFVTAFRTEFGAPPAEWARSLTPQQVGVHETSEQGSRHTMQPASRDS